MNDFHGSSINKFFCETRRVPLGSCCTARRRWLGDDKAWRLATAMFSQFAQLFSAEGGKTFRPRHGHKPGSTMYRLHLAAEKTLGSGNLRDAVALPEGVDLNEWIATKAIDLFNEVELVYSVIRQYCTESACPCMSAGSKFEYLWADGKEYKQPTKVTAPKYVELLFAWVQCQLDDEKVFPTAPGVPFPPDFRERVQAIFKRLFRVYAHIFYGHYERVKELEFEHHLNSCFKHFMYCVLEYDLVRSEELKPLQALMDGFLKEDDAKWGPYRPGRGVHAAAAPLPPARATSAGEPPQPPPPPPPPGN